MTDFFGWGGGSTDLEHNYSVSVCDTEQGRIQEFLKGGGGGQGSRKGP